MNNKEQIFLLNARNTLTKEYVEKKRRFDEVFQSASSASVSSGAGSKSYANHDLTKLREELDRIAGEIRKINRRLSGCAAGIRHIATIRS